MRIKAHITLRPCKYCGGEAAIIPVKAYGKTYYLGMCTTAYPFCRYINYVTGNTEREARIAWNRKQEGE